MSPIRIEDEKHSGASDTGYWMSFRSGKREMQLNAFHDMVAATSAYLSLLEHVLVFSLAFCGFDPDRDDLTKIIGSRWKEKWTRVLGADDEAGIYLQRLTNVVERWRNRTHTEDSKRVTLARSGYTCRMSERFPLA